MKEFTFYPIQLYDEGTYYNMRITLFDIIIYANDSKGTSFSLNYNWNSNQKPIDINLDYKKAVFKKGFYELNSIASVRTNIIINEWKKYFNIDCEVLSVPEVSQSGKYFKRTLKIYVDENTSKNIVSHYNKVLENNGKYFCDNLFENHNNILVEITKDIEEADGFWVIDKEKIEYYTSENAIEYFSRFTSCDLLDEMGPTSAHIYHDCFRKYFKNYNMKPLPDNDSIMGMGLAIIKFLESKFSKSDLKFYSYLINDKLIIGKERIIANKVSQKLNEW